MLKTGARVSDGSLAPFGPGPRDVGMCSNRRHDGAASRTAAMCHIRPHAASSPWRRISSLFCRIPADQGCRTTQLAAKSPGKRHRTINEEAVP
jgi:hypothetical protein